MKAVLVIGLSSGLVACSSAPSEPARAPSSPQVATPATAPATGPATATTTVPLTADLAALTKTAREHGYTPRSHNGVIVFCKTDQQVGTRFQSTSCISQADVANVVHKADDEKQDVQAMQRKSLIQPTGN